MSWVRVPVLPAMDGAGDHRADRALLLLLSRMAAMVSARRDAQHRARGRLLALAPLVADRSGAAHDRRFGLVPVRKRDRAVSRGDVGGWRIAVDDVVPAKARA